MHGVVQFAFLQISFFTLEECCDSKEHAHKTGQEYTSSRAVPFVSPSPLTDNHSSLLQTNMTSHASTPNLSSTPLLSQSPLAGRVGRQHSHDTSDLHVCRNSLFPNVVKKQSRCMSVLLQQGPHGGIRRTGPLLITKERGGNSIRHLNPAFVEMMDVHPVDSGTAAFLKRSNIRRRSFSIMPEDSNGDWLSTISNIIGGADTSDGSKEQSRRASLGPGMWWPLNDDNCSDEVAYDVHVASHDTWTLLLAGRASSQAILWSAWGLQAHCLAVPLNRPRR
ncbi:hypothetical protein BX661DRAFT_26161 [Kickxella alabastrina]|uniref:uncharacterized protein n=1 Tax=Kickxella alabastrina TaxID=61397 RepID=UPI002220B635|nr:uncharacterized protein BX661DRAFT_26161 [Kickxella alabastrina]KAI7827327.1 hypothetical protein BX661DRAFT_26161 [Kickxella alabastrina]